jgi:Trk K+ transport system NAD-binding subunit
MAVMNSTLRVPDDDSARDCADRSEIVDRGLVTSDSGDDRPANRAVVVGGGQVGRVLARRLIADRPVHYLDDDRQAVERAMGRHDATHVDDLTDRASLAAVVDETAHVVVATGSDATNLLVAQHCRAALAAARVVVLVADPRTFDAYPSGVERVCAASILVDAVVATLDEPPSTDRERA